MCVLCSSAPSPHPALPEGVKNPFATARSAVLDAKGAGYNAGNDETPNPLIRVASPRRSGRRSDDWCTFRDSNPDADGCGFQAAMVAKNMIPPSTRLLIA